MDLSIGQLARRSGVKVPTIRFYEQIGLLPPAARSAGNQRRYGAAAAERLAFIRHARALGFEVEAIRELLRLAAHPAAPCHDADTLATRHLAAVEARIQALFRLRDELARMVAACRGGTVAECRVLQVVGDHGLCEVHGAERAEIAGSSLSPGG
jgi:DNA-binding transcriptional MerR regulator